MTERKKAPPVGDGGRSDHETAATPFRWSDHILAQEENARRLAELRSLGRFLQEVPG